MYKTSSRYVFFETAYELYVYVPNVKFSLYTIFFLIFIKIMKLIIWNIKA